MNKWPGGQDVGNHCKQNRKKNEKKMMTEHKNFFEKVNF